MKSIEWGCFKSFLGLVGKFPRRGEERGVHGIGPRMVGLAVQKFVNIK
jgi:hypothetical protein